MVLQEKEPELHISVQKRAKTSQISVNICKMTLKTQIDSNYKYLYSAIEKSTIADIMPDIIMEGRERNFGIEAR